MGGEERQGLRVTRQKVGRAVAGSYQRLPASKNGAIRLTCWSVSRPSIAIRATCCAVRSWIGHHSSIARRVRHISAIAGSIGHGSTIAGWIRHLAAAVAGAHARARAWRWAIAGRLWTAVVVATQRLAGCAAGGSGQADEEERATQSNSFHLDSPLTSAPSEQCAAAFKAGLKRRHRSFSTALGSSQCSMEH